MTEPQATCFVLYYRGAEGFAPLAVRHGPAHVERLREFRERGLVLMAGPVLEPWDGSSMAVFTSREAVDEFVAGDPFVRHGVVATWSVRPWAEGLGTG